MTPKQNLKPGYSAYAQSAADKYFASKHQVAIADDPAGNGEDVWGAIKVKEFQRLANRFGYDPKQDVKDWFGADKKTNTSESVIYEAEEAHVAHCTSMMKHLNRTEDDAQHIVTHNIKRLAHHQTKLVAAHAAAKASPNSADARQELARQESKVREHIHGLQSARNLSDQLRDIKTQISYKIPQHFKEEVEELDELSKGLLGRYLKKAASTRSGHNARAYATSGDEREGHFKKVGRRVKGMDRAVDKLTKEEAEELDELSNKTLGKYLTKAERQVPKLDKQRDAAINARQNDKARKLNQKGNKRSVGIERASDRLGYDNFKPYRVEELELDEKREGFHRLEKHLAAHGVKNPSGLAAYIGRKKYGKKNFDKHAEEGKKFNESTEVLDEALSDFKHKNVQGLYHFTHYEHPSGAFIQVKVGGHGQREGVYRDKDGKHHPWKGLDTLKTLVKEDIDSSRPIIKKVGERGFGTYFRDKETGKLKRKGPYHSTRTDAEAFSEV